MGLVQMIGQALGLGEKQASPQVGPTSTTGLANQAVAGSGQSAGYAMPYHGTGTPIGQAPNGQPQGSNIAAPGFGHQLGQTLQNLGQANANVYVPGSHPQQQTIQQQPMVNAAIPTQPQQTHAGLAALLGPR